MVVANFLVTLVVIPENHQPGHGHNLADIADWPAGVSLAELGYLDGVTSAIQTQLDAKIESVAWGDVTGKPAQVSGPEITAGTETAIRQMSPADIVAFAQQHGGGGGSGGLSFSTVTGATTATAGSGYLADTSAGAFTITLPASPAAGARVVVADATGDWQTNNVTLGRNGNTIEGATEDLVLDVSDLIVTMLYTGSDWQVFAEARSFDQASGDMMKSTYDTNDNGVVDEAASLTGFTDNSANWDTAFGWGDHSVAGYLTAVAWGDVTGKPSFATVATSGAYADLSGTPSIPNVSDAAYDEAAWNGDTDAPTKNAVRDAIENLDTGGVSGSTIYGLGMIL